VRSTWLTLPDFARAIRVHWKVAFRYVQSGEVRARSERRGRKRLWLIHPQEVKRILADPPWLRQGYRGVVPPKRVSRSANPRVRVRNPAWYRARVGSAIAKKRP